MRAIHYAMVYVMPAALMGDYVDYHDARYDVLQAIGEVMAVVAARRR